MNKDIFSVSNSILIGLTLVALSIFFSGSFQNNSKSNSLAISPTPTTSKTLEGEKVTIKDRKDAPKIGAGKVVIYEFSDFQCPFCQKFYKETYSQIKKNYIDTGKITFVYRHFPLTSIHQFAEKAAEAAECANSQDKFWQYHDLLFNNSKSDGGGLSVSDLGKYAVEAGLDTAKFNTCLGGGGVAEKVAEDLKIGQEAGVTGTPAFFINGKKLVGAQPYAVFKQAIDEALK